MAETTLELVQGKGNAEVATRHGRAIQGAAPILNQQDELDRIRGGVSRLLRENGVDLDVIHAVEDMLLGQRTTPARRLKLLTKP